MRERQRERDLGSTGADGRVVFPGLRPGEWSAEAVTDEAGPGEQRTRGRVLVEGRRTARLTLRLAPTGGLERLTGRLEGLTDEERGAAAQVEVRCGELVRHRTLEPLNDGRFELLGLVRGSCELDVRVRGFEPLQQAVQVPGELVARLRRP